MIDADVTNQPTKTYTMKIFVLTDEPALQTALAAALLAVGHELTDDRESADVTLVDMPSGFNFDAMVVAVATTGKTVLWGRSMDAEFAYQASTLGVRGLVSKLAPIEDQVQTLIAAGDGRLVWPRDLVEAMLSPKSARVKLTRRESELVMVVCRGLSNKEIAYQLGIGEATVKVYLSRLFDKLKVQSRHELAVYGIRAFGFPAGKDAPRPAKGFTHVLLKAA